MEKLDCAPHNLQFSSIFDTLAFPDRESCISWAAWDVTLFFKLSWSSVLVHISKIYWARYTSESHHLLKYIPQTFQREVFILLYRVPIVLILRHQRTGHIFNPSNPTKFNRPAWSKWWLRTTWLQNFPVLELMPIMEVPVKINSGFHGRGMNFITIVHLVVIS